MENYIILHHYRDGDLLYLNPKFVESVFKSDIPNNPDGTTIYCFGREKAYWVKEDVEEVRKKVWGTI